MFREVSQAIREYRCDTCGRSIPEGSKYLKLGDTRFKYENVHLICGQYANHPELPWTFNRDWRSRAKPQEVCREYY